MELGAGNTLAAACSALVITSVPTSPAATPFSVTSNGLSYAAKRGIACTPDSDCGDTARRLGPADPSRLPNSTVQTGDMAVRPSTGPGKHASRPRLAPLVDLAPTRPHHVSHRREPARWPAMKRLMAPDRRAQI